MFEQMNCPSPEDLCALREGEIDEPRRSAMTAHREACPACREAWRQLDGLSRLLRSHPAEPFMDENRSAKIRTTLMEACRSDFEGNRSRRGSLRSLSARWKAVNLFGLRDAPPPAEPPLLSGTGRLPPREVPPAHRPLMNVHRKEEKMEAVQVLSSIQSSNLRRWASGVTATAVVLGCGAGLWVAGQRIAAERNRLLPETETRRLLHKGPAESLAFSPSGPWMAVGEAAPIGRQSRITLWDSQTGLKHAEMKGHGEATQAVAFSPEGRILATGGRDNAVRLWDAASGQPIHTLAIPDGWVTSMAFSPDGRLLAVGGGAGKNSRVRLWEVPTGSLKSVLKGHAGNVSAVHFTRDGQRLISGSWDGSVRVWETSSGQFLKSLSAGPESVTALALTSDDRLVAAAGMEGTILLWDLATGQLQKKLDGHTSTIHGVAFSPDDRYLASVGNDSLIRLWDAETGRVRQTLRQRHDPPCSVAFSPDGQTLAVGFYNLGKVKLWDWKGGKSE
ncbi:MAG: hypothetical protein KY468_11685 [Armatimonadetes bacterium]|nr:hypothetical protein [Armatimonadota bacterium]